MLCSIFITKIFKSKLVATLSNPVSSNIVGSTPTPTQCHIHPYLVGFEPPLVCVGFVVEPPGSWKETEAKEIQTLAPPDLQLGLGFGFGSTPAKSCSSQLQLLVHFDVRATKPPHDVQDHLPKATVRSNTSEFPTVTNKQTRAVDTCNCTSTRNTRTTRKPRPDTNS